MLWGESFPVQDKPAISWLFYTGLFSPPSRGWNGED